MPFTISGVISAVSLGYRILNTSVWIPDIPPLPIIAKIMAKRYIRIYTILTDTAVVTHLLSHHTLFLLLYT